MTALLLVMLGGAVGAVLRYLADRIAVGLGRPGSWGTFLVNLTGSLLLGLVAGAGLAAGGWIARLLGTGFCGALTTYSTFAYEVVQRGAGARRDRWLAAGYAAGTLLLGLAMAAGGYRLAELLTR
ncbi:fluoride efflux transporter FluC [Solwaraspora sp. WMMB335]|uniref:fluoride efflux transporter FluC n=1 Tax=Solwaraspora sp. WMMB335 TaxID=3404118 RepID=UPI003B95077A